MRENIKTYSVLSAFSLLLVIICFYFLQKQSAYQVELSQLKNKVEDLQNRNERLEFELNNFELNNNADNVFAGPDNADALPDQATTWLKNIHELSVCSDECPSLLNMSLDEINAIPSKRDKDTAINELSGLIERRASDVLKQVSIRLKENHRDYATIEVVRRFFLDQVDPRLVLDLKDHLNTVTDPDAIESVIELSSNVLGRYSDLDELHPSSYYNDYLDSPFPQVRKAALKTLQLFPTENAISIASSALFDENASVRKTAIELIDYGDFSAPAATVERLLDIAEYDYAEDIDRTSAILALSNLPLSKVQKKRLAIIIDE